MAGLGICARIEHGRPATNGGAFKCLNVPGYDAPIWVRDNLADRSIFWQNLVCQHYAIKSAPHAQVLQARYEERVSSGHRPLIIDCGGNIGLSAIWFAKQFPEATVVTLEPDEGNFAVLQRNIAVYPGISPIHGGIWSVSGHMCIDNPDAGAAALRLRPAATGEDPSVRVYTINDVCGMYAVDDPLVVKVDIEGGQSGLFADNTDWLGRTDLIAIELDDWLMPFQGTSQSFLKAISAYDFDYLLDAETLFCIRHDHV